MSQVLKHFDEAVKKYIRPATYPVALRMLRSEAEIPAGFQKPIRDYGERISICQAVLLSRRLGIPVVVQGEDQACPPAQIVMGFVEPPEWWLGGHFDLEASRTLTLEAGAVMAGSVFRFQPGEYVGLVFAPIQDANFGADMVMVYCNTLQVTMLGMGARHKDGEPLRSTISARFACADTIVQTMLTERCHVALPCGGERRLANAQSDEVIFTAPVSKLGDIVVGLDKVFGGVGTLHPSPVGAEGWLGLQRQLPSKYDKLAKLVGVVEEA